MDDTNTSAPDTDVTLVPPTDVTSTPSPRGATGASSLTSLTDLHRTKVPADDPRLKLERPRSRTLRRGPALAAAGILTAVSAAVVIVALSPSANPAEDAKKNDSDVTAPGNVPLPDVLRESSESDTRTSRPLPPEQPLADPKVTQARSEPAGAGSASADSARQALLEEVARARGATIFAATDDSPTGEPARASTAAASSAAASAMAPDAPADSQRSGGAPDPNLQERKNDFLARGGATADEYSESTLTLPRSPYELKAGTVIPTVLITGINSDLPGKVVGQVREHVYDSVTGNYLLIPQGSRLIASYDSMVAWGQERVLVCWNRVIRPDGSSINLDCTPGVDLAGYAGFSDEVDNHWWRIIGGAAFSSLLAATAQRSQGDVTNYQPSVSQAWAGNAAGQINQAGQQITARNLQLQPTITVRPGFSVNVLVSKDLILPPYRP